MSPRLTEYFVVDAQSTTSSNLGYYSLIEILVQYLKAEIVLEHVKCAKRSHVYYHKMYKICCNKMGILYFEII